MANSNFEVDGEAEDPFADDESESTDENLSEPTTEESEESGNSEPTEIGSGGAVQATVDRDSQSVGVSVGELADDPNPSLEMIAEALSDNAYARENPPVPYAVWREDVSVGRKKRTLDINSDLDVLVKRAESEFEAKYDTEVYRADIRELAMAIGLMHLDELFELMEEWGVEYDK